MGAIRRADRKNDWWIDFRYRGVRVRKRSPVQTLRGAEQFERILRQQFLEENEAGRNPFGPPPPKLAEFAPKWLENYVRVNCRPSTNKRATDCLRVHLLPAFGDLRLDQITVERIDAFRSALLRKGLRPKTVNNTLSMLRRCLTLAVEWKRLKSVPTIRWMKVPAQAYRFLSSDELVRLIAAAPEGYWRALILFIAKTGCRFGEAAGLQWQDVELDGLEPVVRISRGAVEGVVGPTKTNRVRQIPLCADLVEVLRQFRHDGEYVFSRTDGSLPRPVSAMHHLERICKRAQVQRISWHVLRHTFATELTARGVPIRVVQELLGHTTIQMTARYAHVANSSLRAAVEKLPAIPGSTAV
jgi:integrase